MSGLTKWSILRIYTGWHVCGRFKSIEERRVRWLCIVWWHFLCTFNWPSDRRVWNEVLREIRDRSGSPFLPDTISHSESSTRGQSIDPKWIRANPPSNGYGIIWSPQIAMLHQIIFEVRFDCTRSFIQIQQPTKFSSLHVAPAAQKNLSITRSG